MTRFESLVNDTHNLWERGWTVGEIADELELDIPTVRDLLQEEPFPEADPGDMDGDHATALASAGFGTDEDYGHAAEDAYLDSYWEDQYEVTEH